MSRSEAATIVQKKGERPVALIRPFNSSTSKTSDDPVATTSSNFLCDIMAGQSKLLKSEKQPVQKMGEVYSKGSKVVASKSISTTVSREMHHSVTTARKSNDPSKIKSSARFMARFLEKNSESANRDKLSKSEKGSNETGSKFNDKDEVAEVKANFVEGDNVGFKGCATDDQSIGDIVNDIVDEIMDNSGKYKDRKEKHSGSLNTSDDKIIKEGLNALGSKGNSLNGKDLSGTTEQRKCGGNLNSDSLESIKDSKLHNNTSQEASRKLNVLKLPRNEIETEQITLSRPSLDYRRLKDGQDKYSVTHETGGKGNLDYYQPNYLPSEGKSVVNNIPRIGTSSSSAGNSYQEKLERQTIISNQVSQGNNFGKR